MVSMRNRGYRILGGRKLVIVRKSQRTTVALFHALSSTRPNSSEIS